ncbi:MAG: hypothetical protein LH647_05165, partial [Leptolyngbyaceae cyanobacterium CAN_BIN12]|nr:hypothetical protein [Leptolyngbyaceae cyanobacterium CAN_BIN12]
LTAAINNPDKRIRFAVMLSDVEETFRLYRFLILKPKLRKPDCQSDRPFLKERSLNSNFMQ